MWSLLTGKWRKSGTWGFTLPELIISMVLCAFVMLGGGETFRQLVMASAHNTDTMTAIIHAQTAAFWLSQDTLQAQEIQRGSNETGGFPLVLEWTDWDNKSYKVTYANTTMTDELGRTLWEFNRTYRKPDGSNETVMIADHLVPFDDGGTPGGNITDRVDDAGTRCYWSNNTLTFAVVVLIDQESQERTYELKPRSLN